MRRKPVRGLDVGGHWIVPERASISVDEFAFILEVPTGTVRELLKMESIPTEDQVDIYAAQELLSELAACGYTGADEASLFGSVIAGRYRIDAQGRVWLRLPDGSHRGPIEVRTTQPAGAVELDLSEWRTCRDKHRAQRIRVNAYGTRYGARA